MSQVVTGCTRPPEASAPQRKRLCTELANPSETFLSIRNEGYRTASYEVDTTVRQEEEHPRDPNTLLAPVFVHTQQCFSTPVPTAGTKSHGHINQRILWRALDHGPASQKHAAIKLASELGRGADWDAPLEQSINFSLQPLSLWTKCVGTVKPVDISVRLHVSAQRSGELLRDTLVWDLCQPYNSVQQYAAGVCECLGLRFDWYKAIAATVESLLNDIWEECSREGGVSLPCVAADDVGVREPPHTSSACQAPQAQPAVAATPPEDCTMADPIDEGGECVQGPVCVKIELHEPSRDVKVQLTVVRGSGVRSAASTTPESGANVQSAPVKEAIKYVPGQPLLAYKAVSKPQTAWAASREYRVPTLMKYAPQHDTRIPWQQRISAMRAIWAHKDAAAKKQREEEAARASEAEKQAQAVRAAQEKARLQTAQQQQQQQQRATASQPALPAPPPQAAQAPAGPPTVVAPSTPVALVQQAQQPVAMQPQTQAVQPVAVSSAAQMQPVRAPVGGAGGLMAAAPAAQLLQPQQRPAVAPAAAVVQAPTSMPAAPQPAAPATSATAAAVTVAAPQASTQPPAAVVSAPKHKAGVTPGAGAAGSTHGATAQAAGGAQQWHAMLQHRMHQRTRPLAQVAKAEPAAPVVAAVAPSTAPVAPATATAPIAAAAAGVATAAAPSNTLQESITYVTQASQDQLVTAFHEMQRHLQQREQSDGAPPSGSIAKAEEGAGVKPSLT